MNMLGMISLNISFILHILLYIPQVLHNRNFQNIQNLSINMHLILFSCYFLDIFYGFGSSLQWQYCTVAVVGFSLLVIQYLQICYFLKTRDKQLISAVHFGIMLVSVFYVGKFFIIYQAQSPEWLTLTSGYISKVLFIISALPQLIKNWRVENSNALSTHFVLFCIGIACLDTISAWCLDWGWPNKLTYPIMVIMFSLLLPIKGTFNKVRFILPIRNKKLIK